MYYYNVAICDDEKYYREELIIGESEMHNRLSPYEYFEYKE